MYLPKHFESPDRALTLDVMREHSFATLTSADADGVPFATHLPVVVSDTEGTVALHFHLARANPQVAMLRDGRASMMAFLGPHAYLSPKVYPDLKRVPTWNYIAVHAYGPVEEIVEAHRKDALLKSLIALHEPPYAQQWMNLDEKFQETMLGAIAAFRMTVTRLEGKFKLNQHRKEAHATMKVGYAAGTPDEQALGHWMERLGL
ncbi:FMN-binding negative transcriptional regulator [Casimicrobium huifangae]|jgi:transcriptional regulator|uniref:FMN-binding negative transcriptional regulator n=1 Tax=Casimicrobium huifangae TaxID=2591109 RepID=UPI003784EDFB